MKWMFGLLALSCVAQELDVKVLDASGAKVDDAVVTVRQTLSGKSEVCRTNSEARCAVSTAVDGDYQVTAAKDGLAESSTLLRMGNGLRQIELKLSVASVRAAVTLVSGSRIEELQENSPTKVEVVTRDQMQSTGYERVTDVLAEMPGIVTRSGSSAGVGGEQVQGVDSRQVLVLQDGYPWSALAASRAARSI